MTDGPFRNAELSGRWKQFGEELVSDATSAAERSAQACHSMLGDMDWFTLSPVLRELENFTHDRQLDLDTCARARAIFESHAKTPFLDTLQRHLTANLRDDGNAADAFAQALNDSVKDLIGTARSRIEEECIRARDVGDMSWASYRKGVVRSQEAFDGVDPGRIAGALLSGDRQAFKPASVQAIGLDDGPECA